MEIEKKKITRNLDTNQLEGIMIRRQILTLAYLPLAFYTFFLLILKIPF